jgi:pimeloyl-ACP methyl ester carboxylesterase
LIHWTEFGLGKVFFVLLAFFWVNLGFASSCNVLLVPGAFGSGSSSQFLKSEDYFAEYDAFFKSKNCEVLHVQFIENATIESRALMLRDQASQFLKKVNGTELVIIAHSQGGLDARFAISTVKMPGVRSLVTIGTPHRGTPLADWVIKEKTSKSALYWTLKIFAQYDLADLPFAGEMTESFLKRFEDKFKNDPSVQYASAVGSCESDCHWAFKLLKFVSGIDLLGDQGDGIIPASSQAFGEDLGHYNLDHISEVGIDEKKKEERARLLNSVWEFISKHSRP